MNDYVTQIAYDSTLKTTALNRALPSETIASRAQNLADGIEAQAGKLEYALARIFGHEHVAEGCDSDRPTPSIPASLSRAQMALHRIAKCIEQLNEVA